MISVVEEKRSQGPIIAFIDLLFLLVAFLVLILFFVKTNKSEAEVRLKSTEQQLAKVQEEKTTIQTTLAEFAPIIEKFAVMERKEALRRRALAARDQRRKARRTIKIDYRIHKDGSIAYDGRTYTLDGFKTEVVDKLRKDKWIAFRAYAGSDTPFGQVVAYRRRLLKNSGEFDTYWDNLTKK